MSDLKSTLGELAKKLKTKVVYDASDDLGDPKRIPTGIFAFDLATGGGIPEGRISILYGSEGSMKSTVALKAIAQAQKKYPDKRAVYIDIEGRYSSDWAKKMDVDLDRLFVVPIQIAEQVVDIIEAVMYASDVSIIVVDSLAALVTKSEMEKDAEQALVGLTGIVINKLYRKTGMAMQKAKEAGNAPTLLLINQIRFKIGVMFGDPETMPGGPSFKFASSLTIRMYGKDLKEEEVSKELPAYRNVSCVIKKGTLPVVQSNFEFKLALIPNPELGLKVGGSHDTPTIMAQLKARELLMSGAKGGWDLLHMDTGETEHFDKQDEIKLRLASDVPFSDRVRDSIVTKVLKDKND